MTLYEALKPLNLDTLVYIYNVDRPRKGRVQYQKLRNVPWGKIRNDLDRDVMQISIHKENGGVFISVYDKERTQESLNNWGLIDKYFKRKEQRIEKGLIV